MESPSTYYGYDEKGNRIASITAYDANNDINPTEVLQGVNMIKANLVGYDSIINTLRILSTDVENSVIVNHKTMLGRTENVIEDSVSKIKGIEEALDEFYDGALEVHDTLQKEYNARARVGLYDVDGVKYVSSL